MVLNVVYNTNDVVKINLDTSCEYTIGRNENCSVVIKSTSVSRLHAKLVFENDNWWILDCNSTNGTWVNGKKVTKCKINSYDLIRIGDVLLEVNDEDILNSVIINSKNEISDYLSNNIAIVKDVANIEEDIKDLFKKFKANIGDSKLNEVYNNLQVQVTNLISDYLKLVSKSALEMKILFELTKSISEILNLKQLLNIAIDLINELKNVERGMVFLYDLKSDKFIPYVTRRMSINDLNISENQFSRSILEYMKNTNDVVLIKNTLEDTRFLGNESVVMLSNKSILCIPIISQNKLHGAFYLEKSASNPFLEEDVFFLKNFVSAVSVAVDNAKLVLAIKRERHIRSNMERYISPVLIDQLMKASGDIKLDGEKRFISVMFADIKNFTKISETLKVEDVFLMLNKTFTEITKIIFKYDGTLDKFIGDAVMAFFGAPIEHSDDPLRCVKAAYEIIETVKKMSLEYKNEFNVDISFSIGINTGEAIVGNVGSPDRMEYTAIGDTVNLASRLQGKAGYNEIVINETTYQYVKDYFNCEPLPKFFVKGKENAISAYLIKL